MTMQPEPMKPSPKIDAQPVRTPQRSAAPASAPARSPAMMLVYGAVAVAVLAVGVVATGVVHVPGFGAGPGAPTATATQQSDVQQVNEGDAFLGFLYTTLTSDLAKSHQSSQNSGVLVVDVVSTSPIDKAGMRVNDVVIAVDGVPVRAPGDLAAKLRLTPIGQQLSFTLERGGVVQSLTATMGRCLVRDPGDKDHVRACKSWTN